MGDWGFVAAALAIGFLGSSHCIGMCGGIAGALGMAVPGQKTAWGQLAGYSVGRVGSYTLMGALAGALGAAVLPALGPLRLLAGFMLIAMALYIAGWWRGLVWLEKGGSYLWRYLQPLSAKLLPVRSASQAVALGSLWGWLPCGLVYSTLIWASSHGDGVLSAALMLTFGLGTLPTLMATGLMAERMLAFLRNRKVRVTAALLVILFGIWTLPGPHKAWLMGHGGQGSASVEEPQSTGHHH